MPGQREPHCFVDMWSHGACVVAVAGNARHAAADVGSVGDDDRQTLAVAAAGPCREGGGAGGGSGPWRRLRGSDAGCDGIAGGNVRDPRAL